LGTFGNDLMMGQCFLVGGLGVGDAWLFWCGIKQKCRMGLGRGGECRNMGRKHCWNDIRRKALTSRWL